MKSIYDFPDVFDVVMRREPGVVEAEVRSVQTLLARRGMTRGRILELAGGACAHGIPLAESGCSVVGLDRSPAMLEEWRLDGFYSWRDLSEDIVDEAHYFMVLEATVSASSTSGVGAWSSRAR